MKLYLKTTETRIISVDSEDMHDSNMTIDVKDIDEFYSKTKDYDSLDDEIEEQVKEFLENSNGERSLKTFNIKHWVSNRSFGELIDMYENGEIEKPDMQREFIWDSLKCSRLIESIILGLPIPPLFLLEVKSSQYELIDGFQRLSTLVNYVNEYPWSGRSGDTGKRKVKSRLSSKVSSEIAGKTFGDLDSEHQRIIKRSTIPLIEFKQLEPDNLSSKYLIFERINTGSEKLNQMQIRKSLAHGTFMQDLYENANKCALYKSLFSPQNIKKDQHIEAYLRTIVMSKIYYEDFKVEREGINNILNDYCEKHRNEKISKDFGEKFEFAIRHIHDIFKNSKCMFRRVEKDLQGKYIYTGNLNVSILEALVGVCINISPFNHNIDEIEERYKNIMHKTLEESLRKRAENPFSISTGSYSAITGRFSICEDIMGK